MKRIERKQIKSIKNQLDRPTYFVKAFIEGMGIEIHEGFAYVGNLEIDLRFDNLKPDTKILK